MGYYTNYRFNDVVGDVEAIGMFSAKLDEICGFHPAITGGRPSDRIKWYEHDYDIVSAMLHSGVQHVELHGDGEESGDVWDKVYSVTESGVIKLETYRYQLVRSSAPSSVETFDGGKR